MSLRTFRVLVAGATGGVGSGITHGLLALFPLVERLYAVSRDGEKLERLHESTGYSERVVPLAGSVATREAAARLRDAVLADGPLDVVIASLGGWWEGPPAAAVGEMQWRAGIDALLTPHVVCAQTFLPVLEASRGKYLAIGGGAALAPVAGSSLVSIAGAAQAMFVRALVAERDDPFAPLIAELLVDGPIKTAAKHHGPVTPGEITAFEVGKAVAHWALSVSSEPPAFDWPRSLLARDGPITIMHPRGPAMALRTMTAGAIDALADAILREDDDPMTRFEALESMRETIETRPGDALEVVLRLIARADGPERLDDVANGELATLIDVNGPAVIEALELVAKRDVRVAEALGRVFLKDVDPDLAARIRAAGSR